MSLQWFVRTLDRATIVVPSFRGIRRRLARHVRSLSMREGANASMDRDAVGRSLPASGDPCGVGRDGRQAPRGPRLTAPRTMPTCFCDEIGITKCRWRVT